MSDARWDAGVLGQQADQMTDMVGVCVCVKRYSQGIGGG